MSSSALLLAFTNPGSVEPCENCEISSTCESSKLPFSHQAILSKITTHWHVDIKVLDDNMMLQVCETCGVILARKTNNINLNGTMRLHSAVNPPIA